MQKKQKIIIGILTGIIAFIVVCVGCVFFIEHSTDSTEVPHTCSDETETTITTEKTTEEITEETSEPPHEHAYAERTTKEATCTEAGERTFACDCGDIYAESVDATGHSYGEYVSNSDATYTADGTETATCVCGVTDTRTAEGSKLEYTYIDLAQTMYVKANVNVRNLPSTDGTVIGGLSEKQEISISGKCNETGWYRVTYNGNVGYVSNNYLTVERPLTEEELIAQRQEYVNMVLATEEIKNLFAAMQDDISKIEEEYQNFVTMSGANPDNILLSDGAKEIEGYLAEAKEITKYDYLNLEASKGLDPEDEDDAKILAKPYSYNYVQRMLYYNVSWMRWQVNQLFVRTSLVKSAENEWYGLDIDTIPAERRALVEVAVSLLGKIPYEWGGKPQNAGWNTEWNDEGEGLDCSGFIEWVYWTYTGTRNSKLHSTITIVSNQQEISYDELEIGDLGLKSTAHTRYADYSGSIHSSYGDALKANQAVGLGKDEVRKISNHVGIYVGKDCTGRDLWIHCAGGSIETVAITNSNEFVYFCRMPDIDED